MERYLKKDAPFELYDVVLQGAGDEELKAISEEMGLALSVDEMKKVRDHFKKLGRNPTDAELQAIGQAWSEHSCYKSSKALLKERIFSLKNREFIANEDAGLMNFDDEYAYAVAIESHNHPSAIEPYGGAATGVGGILRDIACMGAQPIALIDPLFFGNLDTDYREIPKGVKHPRYLFSGVVAGIRDYGNRMGIPTVAGITYFHEGYTGNPLVNVGSVGIVRKDRILHSRVGQAGDVFILAGGRTGRDGIHGVTFASLTLHEDSEEESRGAVQLGDPITEEPLFHACFEANEFGLVEGMKDLGGGGLSSCVGEMALAAGLGAEVELDSVPLKEEDMAPWEIWISESQERMMLVVKPESVDKVLKIFDKWDVLANPIGKAVKGNGIRVRYTGIEVIDLDLNFYTAGPVYRRRYAKPKRKIEENIPEEPENYEKVLLKVLTHPNIASKEWVIRQYDHQVRGSSVLTPMQGRIGHETHGDASLIKPREESWKGLAISTGISPRISEINPYWGAWNAVDEAYRGLVSVGARPHSLSDCLNFGNPEEAHRFWEFRESIKALGEAGKSLGLPYASGNVSFYNESPAGAIPPTPTIMGIGIMADIRKRVTSDFKRENSHIYIVGSTGAEMGGSIYYEIAGGKTATVPKVDSRGLRKNAEALLGAMEKGLVLAAHDISEGGTAVALGEMCFGGNIGADIDIGRIGKARADVKLFSESPSRWLVEVPEEKKDRFENTVNGALRIGRVGGKHIGISDFERLLLDVDIERAYSLWKEALWKIMG